jgi:hypothetical protein
MRSIHSLLLGLAALASMGIGPASQAAIIVEYDLDSITTASPPATFAATTVDPNVSALSLSRGAGINAAGLARGFSSNDFDPTNATVADAIADNEYLQWGFTTNPNTITSLQTMNFSLRRSATNAHANFELRASLDDFATPGSTVATFQYLGRSSGTAPGVVVPFQWMTTDTPGQDAGNPITPIVLSTTPILAAIPGSTNVTFRLYAFGALPGAALTNTIALGRADSATSPPPVPVNGPGGPSIEGIVVLIPEPASGLLLMGSALGLVLAARSRR